MVLDVRFLVMAVHLAQRGVLLRDKTPKGRLIGHGSGKHQSVTWEIRFMKNT